MELGGGAASSAVSSPNITSERKKEREGGYKRPQTLTIWAAVRVCSMTTRGKVWLWVAEDNTRITR